MITPEIVWNDVWPTVENLIQATLKEDEEQIKKSLLPKSQAAEMYDLYGRYVFDIVLKTVLGRGSLSVTRAIETENGRCVHVEYVWPDPEAEENAYTAADLVSVKLKKYRYGWRVAQINPAAADLPLTEARAAGILISSKALSESGGLPSEAWVLPVALYGGALQIQLREEGLQDAVEALFLPGLQQRGYGLLSQLGARRLWRDFRQKYRDKVDEPAGWAAAVEFVMNQQAMRDQSQAAVAKHYGVTLGRIAPRVRRIKHVLKLGDDLDERYTAVQSEQIVLKEDN